MAEPPSSVADHYARGGLLTRVLAALRDAGIDLDNLRAEDVYPLDQLHGRGLLATREHGERTGITSAMHVLDLGCGVGGAARYLAQEIGCRVTGIDLTAEFIAVARELTARCGLAEKAAFEQADALDLPFEEGTFDHVWSHNVTMNIADKTAFAAEAARVLRQGARLSLAELARGPAGEPTFPLPWAREPAHSFMATPAEMREALEAGGLRVIEQIDDTETSLASAREAAARAGQEPPPPLGPYLIMGDDLPARASNVSQARIEGRIVDQFIIAEKP